MILPERQNRRSDLKHHRSSRRKKRLIPAIAAAAVLCAAALAVILSGGAGCAVYMNGTELGSAASRSEANEILDSARATVSRALGYEYELSGVSVSASLTGRRMAPEELELAILNEVSEVVRMHNVYVDGEPVGSTRDGAGLEALLDGYLNRYSGPDTVSASFLQNVQTVEEYAAADREKTLEELDALLSPENLYSSRSLTVVTREEIVTSEVLYHGCRLTEDPARPAGERTVVTAGEDGEQTVTVTVTFENGLETARSEPVTAVLRAPVTEELIVGTKPPAETASRGMYIWPTNGIVTCPFGYRDSYIGSSNHKGLDIGGVYGQDIVAADGGEVIFADYDGDFGYVVRIRHDSGAVTWYAHCSALCVSVGQRVSQGEKIAEMGATGLADGEHVHFEIRIDDVPQDPLNYLPW